MFFEKGSGTYPFFKIYANDEISAVIIPIHLCLLSVISSYSPLADNQYPVMHASIAVKAAAKNTTGMAVSTAAYFGLRDNNSKKSAMIKIPIGK